MNELIQNLVEALREELKEYGEMLARLDLQQEAVVQQRTPEVLSTSAALQAQIEAIAAARREREQRQRRVACQLGLPDRVGFSELAPRLPQAWRPLVLELVRENNDLLTRVQLRVRQNHLLLTRAVELMQKLFGSLFPGSLPSMYGDSGRLLARPPAPQPMYEAIG